MITKITDKKIKTLQQYDDFIKYITAQYQESNILYKINISMFEHNF